jgi:hypothetical protein
MGSSGRGQRIQREETGEIPDVIKNLSHRFMLRVHRGWVGTSGMEARSFRLEPIETIRLGVWEG